MGEFYHIHSIASDSKGNIYLGESFGERAMRCWRTKDGIQTASGSRMSSQEEK